MKESSAFQAIAEEMKDAFRQGKQDYDNRQLPIPDGTYVARIQSCAIKKSKSSENHYVETAYYIMEGEQKGRIEYDRIMIQPEKAPFIIRFFESFGCFDTNLLSENVEENLNSFCETINQSSPLVKITTKQWSNTEKGSSGVNYFLNQILEGIEEATNDSADSGNDGLNEITDKAALKKIAMEEELDINPVQFVRLTVDELRTVIRECRNALGDQTTSTEAVDPETEEKRQKLLQLCQSQNIQEATEEMTLEELKLVIFDEEKQVGYTFETSGENALTEEEIELLIDVGLDGQINQPEEKPEPPKQKAKAPAKEPTKTPAKTMPNKGKLSLPAKKGGRK